MTNIVALGAAMLRAASELPQGFDLVINISAGVASVHLALPDTDAYVDDYLGDTLADKINRAVDDAKARNVGDNT